MVESGSRIEIEVRQGAPFQGWVVKDGAAPVEFCGWRELRSLVEGRPAQAKDLTQTERRVAALASEGLTNQQIAEQLHLSPRTIQWHLGRAFRKLGLRSRTELAARWSGARD